MLRSYWCIGFAALLAATPLSAQQASDADSGQRSTNNDAKVANNTPSPIAPAIDRVANELAETRKDQADPYGDQRNEREKRDLIAQEDSAYWAGWNFIAMIAQTLLAGGALFALLCDLRQNRKSAEAQLRAYISVDPGGINEAIEGNHRIPYNIINSGQTPAYDLAVFGDILIIEGTPMNFDPMKQGRLGAAEASTDITLGPQSNHWTYAYQGADLFAPFLDKIDQKKAAIIHYGFIQYRDAFGVTRKTHFAFYHWGEELSDLESKRCRFGNHAT